MILTAGWVPRWRTTRFAKPIQWPTRQRVPVQVPAPVAGFTDPEGARETEQRFLAIIGLLMYNLFDFL